MGLFKSKKQKIMEQIQKDIHSFTYQCRYHEYFDLSLDFVVVLPAVHIKNDDSLKFMKYNRYCTIDSIIYTVYLISYMNFALISSAKEFYDEIMYRIQFNLSIILKMNYGLNEKFCVEMISNRFALYDKTIQNIDNKDIDKIVNTLYAQFICVLTTTMNEQKYIPFFVDSAIYIDDIFSQAEKVKEVLNTSQFIIKLCSGSTKLNLETIRDFYCER